MFDDRVSHSLNTVGLALEGLHSQLESVLFEVLTRFLDELLTAERAFHGKDLQELFLASFIVVGLDDVHHTVPDDVRDIHTDTLTHQGVTALLINNGTLLVHHIIVLEQTLTDTEIVLLHLLLGTLDTLGHHTALDTLTVLNTQTVHHLGDTLTTEEAHQLILKRNVEY